LKRFLAVFLLILAGCSPGRRIEVVRLCDLHTEHLDRLEAEVCVRNGGAKAVTLYCADVTLVYRDRRMCRLVVGEPIEIAPRSVSEVTLRADMEIYDLAVVSAFSKMFARDSDKALSFIVLNGTATVGEGSRRRKINLR